jgi:hypothetical protein
VRWVILQLQLNWSIKYEDVGDDLSETAFPQGGMDLSVDLWYFTPFDFILLPQFYISHCEGK